MRFTPPGQRDPASKFPQSSASLLALGSSIAAAALAVFLAGLFDDSFIDEYAYITQSYYADLFFDGRHNDPSWLDDMALDLQPLPKYFIGPMFHLDGQRMPGRVNAYRWYYDAKTRFGNLETLTVARLPFIAMGMLGCLALFGVGLLVGGRAVGTVGALFLMINPLYRLHAHRAMSDVPCEAFMIAAFGLGLWGMARIWNGRRFATGMLLFAISGVCAGLAILCKLNGLLAPIVIAAWCGLGLLVRGIPGRVRAALMAGAILGVVTMAATVLALNPALTSHPTVAINPALADRVNHGPLGRFVDIVKHRITISTAQRDDPKFARDVVRTPFEKASVFAVQGFGRFGPLGPSKSNSEVRYDAAQDWGLVAWWPFVLIGIVATYRLGRRQLSDGAPPTALALLVWVGLSWAVVAGYLPLAWDRYFLPIQAPNALLAAVGIVAIARYWRRKGVSA